MNEPSDQEEHTIDVYEGPCPDCRANCFVRTVRVPGQSPLIPDSQAMVRIALSHKEPSCPAYDAIGELGDCAAADAAVEAWLKRAGMWPLPCGELVRQVAS